MCASLWIVGELENMKGIILEKFGSRREAFCVCVCGCVLACVVTNNCNMGFGGVWGKGAYYRGFLKIWTDFLDMRHVSG